MLQSFFRWIGSFFQKKIPLRIDRAAAEEILKVVAEQGIGPKWFLRLTSRGDPVNGYNVGMGFATEPEPGDYATTVQGIPVLIDRKAIPVFTNMDIKFYEGEGRRGFTFHSPLLTGGR